jgi:hypothetical protein
MAGKDTLAVIAEQLGLALTPIQSALSGPDEFSEFMLILGWNTATPIADIQNLGSIATNILNAVEGGLDESQAANVISQLVNFFSAVSKLTSASGLAATIDPVEFASDFPGQLVDFLVADYLLSYHRVLGAGLLAAGVIRRTLKPAAGQRPAYTRLDIAWNDIGNVLNDPLGIFRNAYSWGPAFDQQLFLQNMNALGQGFGLTVFSSPVSGLMKAALTQGATSLTNLQDFALRWQLIGNLVIEANLTAGLDFYALPPTASAAPGIATLPYVTGSGGTTITISDRLSLILKAAFDLAGGIIVGIRPNQPVALATGIFGGSPGSAAAFSVTLKNQDTTGTKQVLLGTEGASRLDYASLSLAVGFRTDSTAASFYTEAALTDAALVIVPGADADGFLAQLLPPSLSVDASITAGLDSRLGVYFSGSAGLEIEIPAHISLGPIEIQSATISVSPSSGAIPISLGATLQGNLGPLQAVVEDVGLTVNLTFPKTGGNLGPVAAALAFKPPKGVGLSVNAGVVTGGGYLYIDTARGEYAGALQLEIADFLSVAAIGLISTKMPDGSKGFSLLIILTADFGAGIQLSFGFTLLAVGGLLGLNRTMLFQPLMDGVRTGSIQSIMFPQDVIANAPRIISDLRAIFPPQEGTFLIGPMAKIGWGEPTLISLSLGVIIEIPPGDAAILGILRMALPADDIAILVLQVNFAGALEFDKQRFYFFASLFDSHILFITLSGQMGLLFAYGDDANFVVSVGGFHPQFNPPPLPFPSPQRISIDLINESYARIHADGYFAVTTNTVQFGTHSDFFFGFSACSVSGSSGFDALIQFSPFHFTVEISSQFSVQVFGVGVYGVGIDVSLSGPTPWHVHGTASLSFFFFSIDIGIDFTWGDDPNTTLPPVAVMPILAAEAQKASNWKTALPANVQLLVVLRQLDPSEASFVLHPAGTLQISQRSVPLDLKIDKVGSQAPSDANQFAFSVSGTVLTKTRDLQEPFAPSQFRNFDDATKLSQPAFVPQDSGIELAGSATLASATAITRPVRYDLTIVDAENEPVRSRFFPHARIMFTSFLAGNSAGQSKLSANFRAQTRPYTGSVAVSSETFAVALQSSNQVFRPEAAAFLSQAKAHDYIANAVAADPSLEGVLHVIPQFEVAA